MKRKFLGKHFRNKNELKDTITKQWNNINREFCNNLVQSMSPRILAVLRAKGRHTKYYRILSVRIFLHENKSCI